MESLVSLPTFTHSFQGNPLITVTWQGRPAWIARHIGARLGYHDEGKRFPNTILGEWKDEFIEGKDYVVLAGEDLAAFKELPGAEGVSPHAHNSLLLLFESGLHLALIKTRKKLGQDLRRFLAEEVMPQLVRTGAYQPEGTRSPTLVLVTLAPPPPRPTVAERREVRLGQQATTRERWVDFCDRRLQVQTLHRTIDRLEEARLLTPEEVASLQVTAAEIALDADLAVLKPESERWVTPGQIARRWGVTKEKVERISSVLGLRGHRSYSRRVLRRYGRTESGEPRRVLSWAYNGAAEALIEEVLDAMGCEPVHSEPVEAPVETPDAAAAAPKDAA